MITDDQLNQLRKTVLARCVSMPADAKAAIVKDLNTLGTMTLNDLRDKYIVPLGMGMALDMALATQVVDNYLGNIPTKQKIGILAVTIVGLLNQLDEEKADENLVPAFT